MISTRNLTLVTSIISQFPNLTVTCAANGAAHQFLLLNLTLHDIADFINLPDTRQDRVKVSKLPPGDVSTITT